jgi:hypothetical protein
MNPAHADPHNKQRDEAEPTHPTSNVPAPQKTHGSSSNGNSNSGSGSGSTNGSSSSDGGSISSSSSDINANNACTNTVTLITTFTSKVREWVTLTLTSTKWTAAFQSSEQPFHARSCNSCSKQASKRRSAHHHVHTFMMTSSSSAYGSSFHDNGDGSDNKMNFFTPGKRKSNRDDDENDDGTSKGAQGGTMTPKDRCKGWCGHTSSWHQELVGPELQSVLQANHPQHAGGLQREQMFHNTGCPGHGP